MINDINIEINTNTDTITITNDDLVLASNKPRVIITCVSIVDGENSEVSFNSFKCGFFVRDANNTTIEYKTFPQPGEVIKYSPDGIVLTENLDQLEFNTSYTLHVYAEDAGLFYDKTASISVPKSIRPYDPNGDFNSWNWNDSTKEWEPPVSKPDDVVNGFYKWNEESQQWGLVDTTPFQ
jgi:hypothetical protein